MNPLVLFIMAHARQTWYTPAVRAAYEATYGTPNDGTGRSADTVWRSALGQAYAIERRRTTLEAAHGNQLVRNALFGVLGGTGDVNVRHLVRGTDAAGLPVHAMVDVRVSRGARVGTIPALAAAAIRAYDGLRGVQVNSVTMMYVQPWD